MSTQISSLDIDQFLAGARDSLIQGEVYSFTCCIKFLNDDSLKLWGSVFKGGEKVPLPNNPIPPFRITKGAIAQSFHRRFTLQEYTRILRGEVISACEHGTCSECDSLRELVVSVDGVEQ